MKLILKLVAGVVALAIVSVAVLYFQDPIFWKRYQLLKEHRGILPQSGWEGSEFIVKGGEHRLFELVPQDQRSIPEATLKQVSDFAEQRNSSSLLVWHNDTLQFRKHYQGIDTDTEIVGKSMAKMVLSLAIARAIKQGFIPSLDEPAASYLNEWQGTPKAKVTIRHMLHMAAGFEKYYTLDPSPFGKFMRSYIGGKNEQIMLNDYEVVNEPGSTYDYSQVTSDLLGLLLERATGKP